MGNAIELSPEKRAWLDAFVKKEIEIAWDCGQLPTLRKKPEISILGYLRVDDSDSGYHVDLTCLILDSQNDIYNNCTHYVCISYEEDPGTYWDPPNAECFVYMDSVKGCDIPEQEIAYVAKVPEYNGHGMSFPYAQDLIVWRSEVWLGTGDTMWVSIRDIYDIVLLSRGQFEC